MKITIYQGTDGLHYWRATARNSRIVADGAEAYASRRNAMRAVRAFCLKMRGTVEVVV